MNQKMTRNAFPLLAFLFLLPASSFATESPLTQGLGGAGRAGIPTESLFNNPAALALSAQSTIFAIYEKPRIPDWNAGGRAYALGAYDVQTSSVKGGIGYLRTSRARLGSAGRQDYEDRSEIRSVFAHQLWDGVQGGLKVGYITRRVGVASEKFFNGDIGAIFPVYAGVFGGLTYENVLTQPGEKPGTAGAGLTYGLGYGIQLYGDGTRVMKGPRKGDRGWALGAELAVAGDFKLRAGRFQEGLRRLRGWSLGLSWTGPRASFDYAMRTAGDNPNERDHIFGMTVAM